jgi:acyl dehydratase
MYFDELKLGMTVDTEPVAITKEKMMKFAYEYDPIPLHTDEEYAKTTPFGALIAPGIMSFMSVWAKYLEVDFFGKALLAGKSSKIEWIKPVYAGDTLRGTTTITNLIERSKQNGLVELTVEVRNQKGELVIVNTTEAIVKCKPREEA